MYMYMQLAAFVVESSCLYHTDRYQPLTEGVTYSASLYVDSHPPDAGLLGNDNWLELVDDTTKHPFPWMNVRTWCLSKISKQCENKK